jgi:hypothetical protein
MKQQANDSAGQLTEILKPIIVLIKKIDKLANKNNDIFLKAYFKLLVVAFPCLLSLFVGG